MRLIAIDMCHPGMKLGKPICNEKGKILLAQGSELTDTLLKKLKRYNIPRIYIEDAASEGIEIVDSIPVELRNEAVQIITEGFTTIAKLSSNRSNIQGMLKSERAIRSFQKIFRSILGCLNENQNALNLLATTKIYENYVYNHSLNVSIYACQLAIENGLPLKNIEEIGLGAMLHDLGKMFIPLEVLNKTEALTDAEVELIKSHCMLGYETLRKVHEIPFTVAHCALQHHERVDGTGYPRSLKEAEIHKYAKILSVADVFDAVTSPRLYRSALLPHKGLELLYTGSGTQFESKQIHLFKSCIAIYPEGLSVKLNDGRIGIVSNYNFNAVGRPEIRIIKDEDQQAIIPYEINLSSNTFLNVEIVEADPLL